jgi:hypothetical protein
MELVDTTVTGDVVLSGGSVNRGLNPVTAPL